MSIGTKIARAFWIALELELPASRRSSAMRFFAGLKPLDVTGYASLLRAFARAVVESDYLPVRKDARHDPVELIAAGLEMCIEQWDQWPQDRRSASTMPYSLCFDIALRVAAFEALYRCRLREPGWSPAIEAVAAESGDVIAPNIIEPVCEVFDGARDDVRKVIGSSAAHGDAILAEIVVLGSASRSLHLAFGRPRFGYCDLVEDDNSHRRGALPLAHGIALLVAGRITDALSRFDAIIDRVPGHTLALEQAARCCAALGDTSRAQSYSKRASRLGRTLQPRSDLLSSDVKVARERPWPRRNGAVSLDSYGAAVASEATR